MIQLGVFATSVAAIAFEILLTRIFSISQWHHLTFMVISTALFGLALSGTLVGIYTSRRPFWLTGYERQARDRPFIIAFCSGILLSFLAFQKIPLDYAKLPVQPVQVFFLLLTFLVFAVPFFCFGIIMAGAYMSRPDTSWQTYLVNMAGSAAGAAVPFFLVPACGEAPLILLLALMPVAVVYAAAGIRRFFLHRTQPPVNPRRRFVNGTLLATLFAGLVVLLLCPEMLQIRPSEYKALRQLRLFPDTVVRPSARSLRGQVDRVESPYIRFAPGLSLQYQAALPPQSAVFKDGDRQLVCCHAPSHELSFARWSLMSAGYRLRPDPRRVLILQNGGGAAVACALSQGVQDITVAEQHPEFAAVLASVYPLTVAETHPRAFLNRAKTLFDIIHVENWGPSLPGTAALNQDDLLTSDAIYACLSHLTEDGVLIAARRLILPPANIVRLCAAAYRALERMAVDAPARHLVVIRNWDTFVMLTSRRPITDWRPVAAFAEEMNFDLVWPQTDDGALLNRFNRFERPFHYQALKGLFSALETGDGHAFFNARALDLAPQTDDRPYPDKFFKWTRAGDIYRMTGGRLYRLLLSGEVVVGVVFVEALLISVLLLGLPLFISRRGAAPIAFGGLIYFFSIGAGFILYEIFFISAYQKLFADPVVSFTVVLAGVMIFSSIGGLLSRRIHPDRLNIITAGLVIISLAAGLGVGPAVDYITGTGGAAALALAMLCLLPGGILLGFPFPLGMRHLLTAPVQRAHAWAANGCASVLFSIVAAQLAVSTGMKSIMWFGAAAYAAAWLSLRRFKRVSK